MQVEKRDKRIVDFDDSKIEAAITKAFESISADTGPVRGLTKEVVQIIHEKERDVIHIEEIQDIVEDTLMLRGFTEIARRYMKYREKHHEARKILQMMGVVDDLKFGPNAATVVSRYLLKDEDGNPTETPSQLFRRVSGAVASIEKKYDESVDVNEYDDLFYYMMANLEFLPNSPTLFNAGTEIGQCSACFVLPIEDNMNSIFTSLQHMAVVQKSGGGTGFSFSRLRPVGSTVGTTGGVASGPISFMKVYDTATDIIKQGGCLSIDTLVQSTKGLRKLGSLVNGRLAVETPLNELVLTRDNYKQAFIAANNGLTDVTRINTHLGYTLDATYNHKIRVLTARGIEWKRANDLKVGDWLVVKRGGYQGIDTDLLSCPPQHHNATPIMLPATMNPRLAEILGYFIGDGCLSYLNSKKARFAFSVSHETPDVAEWIENFFEDFGLSPYREQKENDASWTVGARSVTLAEWWIKSGFDKEGSVNAQIPETIFSSSRESVCGFLRGLYEADGDVSTYGYPRLFSTSEKLIKQVQQVLLSLGIVSRISVNKKRASAYGPNPLYILIITHKPSALLFSKLVGFRSELKRNRFRIRFSNVSGKASDPIPYAGNLIARYYSPPGRGGGEKRGPRSANPKVNKELLRYIRGDRNPHRQRLLELSEIIPDLQNMLSDEVLRDDFVYTKIISLTSQEAFTGDIEVIGSEYVANGFLVHNRRRGANMAILRCDHPDIMEFIACKSDKASFRNFNISIALTKPFLKALKDDKDIDLIAPHSNEPVQSISARAIFDAIVHNAWSTGDPGLIFIDRINDEHPLNGELVESTNPCGEQPLLPYESCVLGSINLSKMVQDGEINWSRLEEVVRLAVRFLDNIIDLNVYPVEEIEQVTKSNRKIGLGIMGFAELLIKLGIPYDSVKGLEKAEEVMSFIRQKAERSSNELAKIRGNFENFALLKKRNKWKRNAALITVAPTGSISLIAQTSSGIEPLFAIAHSRMLAEGINLSEVSPLFEQVAMERGFWNDDIEHEVARTGTVQQIDGVPVDVKKVFKAAHEIDPEWHIRMQAAFQKHTDNAVSKCIHEDTLMLTNQGLVSVKECGQAKGDDSFASPRSNLQVFTGNGSGTERVLSHYSAGFLPATEIRLRSGASLTGATKTHKILTIDGWKNLGDISVNDLVIVKHRFESMHTAGRKPISVDYQLRTNAKDIKLHDAMSEKLALWLGMLAADGSLVESSGAVSFHEKNPDIGKLYISLAKKLFKEKPKSEVDSRTGVVSHIIHSRVLVRYTKALIGNRARNKHVPKQILQGNAAEKLAFVNGLTLDGYLKEKWGLVVYEGMSKKLAYETAEVLRSFGLPYIYQGKKEVKGHGEAYSVYVSNDLQELIQPLEKHKRSETRYKKFLVQINPEEVESLKLPISHPRYSNLRWLKQSKRNYCWNTVAEELGLQILSSVEKVVQVKDVGEVPLYDIEVSKAHTYLVNGIVSHNTVNLPNNATTEDVERIFLLADELQLKGTTVFRDGCLGGVQVLYAGCQDCDT